MSCILCFSFVPQGELFSIYDYGESTMLTAMELIQKHFQAFHEVVFIFRNNFPIF